MSPGASERAALRAAPGRAPPTAAPTPPAPPSSAGSRLGDALTHLEALDANGSRAGSILDQRQIRAKLHWGRDGVLTGEITDRLVGQEAIVIGNYLAQQPADQRQRLAERVLVAAVGAAQVTEFNERSAATDGAIVLRYRFRAKPGDRLNLGVFPMSPGRSFATWAERAVPLDIDLPIRQTVHIELTSDRDFALRALVSSGAALRSGSGSLSAELVRSGDADVGPLAFEATEVLGRLQECGLTPFGPSDFPAPRDLAAVLDLRSWFVFQESRRAFAILDLAPGRVRWMVLAPFSVEVLADRVTVSAEPPTLDFGSWLQAFRCPPRGAP